MSIKFCEKTKTFFLDGKNISYVFSINNYGFAEHRYFGKTIGHDDLSYTDTVGQQSNMATVPGVDEFSSSYHRYPAEISFFGTGDYREPTVEVINASGDRLTELLYDSYEIIPVKPHKLGNMPSMKGGETLVLHLKDKITGFVCDLHYTVYDDVSVIVKRAVYKNEGNTSMILNRAYSFALSLPETDYEVMTLHGAWARERQVERVPLGHGTVSIDSKRTSSSHTFNPFMAVLTKGATESSGEAYGVSLVYSSSFVLTAEGTSDGQKRITGGINDFDFAWKLDAGEELVTPEAVIAYSCEGIGGMSRAFHDAFRSYLINDRFVNTKRPIVINNWEGTYFDFTTEKLKKIADGVVGTGIDTFVLDDGWFGIRNNDRSGLGDWFVNEEKMPGGLDEIIKHVNGLGMKFGLWFEPEMINEDSDLFRSHPDYAIGVLNRPRSYCRHQYVLDLTRADVRDYIVESVNKILKSHNIEYVKWDCNRNVTESFSFGREPERQAEFAHRYALGLYDICERIVESNPKVFFEGCSGGGGRFDPAMLYYFPQIWTSDDTDADERTKIQYGTSVVYPLSSMSCHVSAVPNHQTGRATTEATRAAIAHLGPTGYELDASAFTDDDRIRVKSEVEAYNAISELILKGDLYRTDSPFDGNFFTETVVSKDKCEAVMITYRCLAGVNNEIKRVKAAGLAPDKRYFVPELGRTLFGSTLMNVGWTPNYPRNDFGCVVYHLREVE